MTRGIRFEEFVPPPTKSMQYRAHRVHRTMRRSGVGTPLIEYFLQLGHENDRRTAELDVAVTNPRAQALCERLGFQVKQERTSGIASVPDHRRMVLDL